MAAISILAVSVAAQSAEDLPVTKKGKAILPVKGQFAIGIDATPFFTYAGNLMNLDGYNTLGVNLLNNQVYAKYLLDANRAFRMKFRVTSINDKLVNNVTSDLDPAEEVVDQRKYTGSQFMLTPGFEFRTGTTRLQFVYGAELSFNYMKVNYDFTYGNQFSDTNPFPMTTIDFTGGYSTDVNNRLLENDYGTEIDLGIRIFGGVEYFILPKLSLGSEIGLGYLYSKDGESVSVSEYWDLGTNTLETDEVKQPGSVSSQLTTDILNGRIVLMLYF